MSRFDEKNAHRRKYSPMSTYCKLFRQIRRKLYMNYLYIIFGMTTRSRPSTGIFISPIRDALNTALLPKRARRLSTVLSSFSRLMRFSSSSRNDICRGEPASMRFIALNVIVLIYVCQSYLSTKSSNPNYAISIGDCV